MLDHLIFNNLKWWNVDLNKASQSIGGKQLFVLPPKITINSNTSAVAAPSLNYFTDGSYGYSSFRNIIVKQGTVYKVIGGNQDYYIIQGHFSEESGFDTNAGHSIYDGIAIVVAKDCTPISGG
ncbi:hypothetical protein EJK17_07890 [Lactobacillus xujianguonis]|uniref:Uncharacterized protein n=1 Tax=Lactobacillus xujianguonis TaxID=2495899 RepID=A0A437SU09_9LACO|nr:hypothetical protein [Lactobacillus xujianguonis]RVU70423.1 hypothetical protein EJK17_07890 [Lactobacillus xujianguonis]